MATKKRRIPRQSISDDPVTSWAKAVVTGEIVAGPHVRNACRRHLQDLVDGPARGLRWDVEAARHAINFFPDVLRLAGGQFEGRPFRLHPSQQFRIGSLFGWKRDDGTRRFRRFYDEEGKGNGKSPLAAGIGMYCLLADKEARAEVYAAASIKSQAMVLFRDAVAMWQQSAALTQRLTPSGGNPIWNLADLHTGSFFRPISSEEAHSGPRPSCALCDEIHEHPNRNVIEMLERGFKFRRQPLLVMITNSGSDRNSVCWEEHQHAIRVAAGTMTPDERATYVGEVVDDDTFAFVCGLDADDDPLTDPSCWPKANPLLDVTITSKYLATVVRQARQIPGKLNGILRLHFCVWTDADEAWMSRAALEAVLADFEPSDHAGEEVSAGLDLSAAQDLTVAAYAVKTGTKAVEREAKDGTKTTIELTTYDAWIEAWTPRDTLAERALRDKAPYDVWVDQGHLQTTPGKNIRLDFVAARVAETNAETPIKVLAYDRYSYRKISEHFDEMGLTLNEVEHPQGGKRRAKPSVEQTAAAEADGSEEPLGLWMPGSVLELETLILEGRIRLKRNPVLVSACMSAVMERDPFDNKWFSKRKATNRIDAVVALAMAVGAVTSEPAEPAESIYDVLARNDPAQSAANAADSDDAIAAILADPAHPRWHEMRERYDRQFAMADEDDF